MRRPLREEGSCRDKGGGRARQRGSGSWGVWEEGQSAVHSAQSPAGSQRPDVTLSGWSLKQTDLTQGLNTAPTPTPQLASAYM